MTGLVVTVAIMLTAGGLGWKFSWPMGVQLVIALAIAMLLASTPVGRVILDGAGVLTETVTQKIESSR